MGTLRTGFSQIYRDCRRSLKVGPSLGFKSNLSLWKGPAHQTSRSLGVIATLVPLTDEISPGEARLTVGANQPYYGDCLWEQGATTREKLHSGENRNAPGGYGIPVLLVA